jgi:hypothetical protein
MADIKFSYLPFSYRLALQNMADALYEDAGEDSNHDSIRDLAGLGSVGTAMNGFLAEVRGVGVSADELREFGQYIIDRAEKLAEGA